MKKLAILTTHPIQYYAPVFRLLAERGEIEVKVFYSWGEHSMKKYDPGFGQVIEWDIPLLEGYEYEFLENSSKNPGTHHFRGIVNPKLKQRIEEWKPDAVLVFGWNFHSHLQVMRHFHGRLPVLFRGDSTLLDEQPGWQKVARRLALTWVYHHVDIALYVGTENKRYFLAHGLKERQLVFAPHAIDNERFEDDEKARYGKQALIQRRELGFADDDIVFLFAGKLEFKKGVDLLLDAFLQLNLPYTGLLFAGSGHMESSLKRMAAVNDRVRFLPFQNQSQMPVVHRMGDVFCLPSRGPGETWGLAINEAMACGRPILVSNRCGCAADLVKNGTNGYVFQTGSPGDLAEKIRILYTSGPEKWKQFGLKSREMIKAWSIECLAGSVTAVVKSIC